MPYQLDGANRIVLIVDDEPSICEILGDYVALLGYRPETAKDCNEVINFFDSQTPDIVFLDIKLPVVDGVKILRLIRRLTPEVPVIMMSGVATLDIAANTLKYGAFDYVTKPFFYERISEILQAIDRLTGEKK